MAEEPNTTDNAAVSASALSMAVTLLSALPENDRAEAAAAVAKRLMAAYAGEAVNVVLKCQNAFMERGESEAAASMMSVLSAIWEIEDGAATASAA